MRKLDRERRAREESERLLETKSRELFESKNQIEQQLEELKKVHSELAETQGQLLQSEKLASIGQLAAGVAHEVNNPIGFITSNLSTLSDYVRDVREVMEALVTVRQAADRCVESPESDIVKSAAAPVAEFRAATQAVDDTMKRLDFQYVLEDLDDLLSESIEGTKRVRMIVQDLRDFSHVDAAELGDEDVNTLLDKTISVIASELKYKVELVRDYDDDARILCFGGRLGQVFLNVLMNGVQAIANHGTITLRTRKVADHLHVEIQDTGAGIPPEILNRIYDPFFTTKDVGEGTGLGLNVVHNIIENHGGHIQVESVLGKGTLFRFVLPVSGPPNESGASSGSMGNAA